MPQLTNILSVAHHSHLTIHNQQTTIITFVFSILLYKLSIFLSYYFTHRFKDRIDVVNFEFFKYIKRGGVNKIEIF